MAKNKNNLIMQDNRLIRASYQMNLDEKRLILLAINNIQSNKINDFSELMQNVMDSDCAIFKLRDYEKTYGVSTNLKYLSNTIHSLMKKTLEYKDKERFFVTQWVESAGIENGNIFINFARKIMPFLQYLKENFTVYNFEQIKQLKSVYSIRLYEMLMQYKGTGLLRISVKNYREQLGLKDKYKRYPNLKSRCISSAIEAINKQTNLNIKLKEIKQGRSVAGLEFTFSIKTLNEAKKEQIRDLTTNDSIQLEELLKIDSRLIHWIKIGDVQFFKSDIKIIVPSNFISNHLNKELKQIIEINTKKQVKIIVNENIKNYQLDIEEII